MQDELETPARLEESDLRSAPPPSSGPPDTYRPGRTAKRRSRPHRLPFPRREFTHAQKIGLGILRFGEGESRMRLDELLDALNISRTSSSTIQALSFSQRYGITTGGMKSEFVELTPTGRRALDPRSSEEERCRAIFELAIAGVGPLRLCYQHCVGRSLDDEKGLRRHAARKLPAIRPKDVELLIQIFKRNAHHLGLVDKRNGEAVLMTIDERLGLLEPSVPAPKPVVIPTVRPTVARAPASDDEWGRTCVYLTSKAKDERHAETIFSAVISPALSPLELEVVTIDGLNGGGLGSEIMQHVVRAGLVIADLSFSDPAVFYALGVRHSLNRPVIHLVRKGHSGCIEGELESALELDTADAYSLARNLESYRFKLRKLAKELRDQPQTWANPLSRLEPSLQFSA